MFVKLQYLSTFFENMFTIQGIYKRKTHKCEGARLLNQATKRTINES